MSTKERIVQELDALSQAELEQIAHYLAFVKHQTRIKATPTLDETQLAALYGEFVEEDQQLAEEGLSDYAGALAKEDGE